MFKILFMLLILLNSFLMAKSDEPKLTPMPLNQQGTLGFIYETKIGNDIVKMPFALFLPKSYDVDKTRRYPMILFLHGAGEGGVDLNGVFIHGPCGVASRTPAMLQNLPFIVCSPQSTQGWSPLMIQTVTSLLRSLPEKYRIDRDRITVTGLSMGGLGSWAALADAPDIYGAAAPICARAWAEPKALANALQNRSIWSIVGGADDSAFVNGASIMYTALCSVGADASLTVIPGVGHGVWEQFYNNPIFYHWIARQARPTKEMETQANAFHKLQNNGNALVCKEINPNNVASEANGGVATALNTIGSSGYSPRAAINGDRLGVHWGSDPDSGSGWNSIEGSPQGWLQVDFKGSQTISEIDVFFVQDNYQAPVNPTPTMTFSLYGLTAFQVQYWNGSTWEDVPGGKVENNNLVWKKFTFPEINTSKIRVLINASKDSIARIVEVEAWKPIK